MCDRGVAKEALAVTVLLLLVSGAFASVVYDDQVTFLESVQTKDFVGSLGLPATCYIASSGLEERDACGVSSDDTLYCWEIGQARAAVDALALDTRQVGFSMTVELTVNPGAAGDDESVVPMHSRSHDSSLVPIPGACITPGSSAIHAFWADIIVSMVTHESSSVSLLSLGLPGLTASR